jgi:hypothetical protein
VRWSLVVALSGLLLNVGSPARAADPAAPAAWQRHEMEFVYLGFTTRYSCEGLRDKLHALLLASGARPGMEVKIRGCPAGPGEVTEFPRVHMVFHAAAIAATGTAEPVSAGWKRVTLAARKPMALEAGDCELVEQFRDRVLPAFVTRGLEGEVHCVPHQISGSSYRLRFESLQGAAAGAAATR